MERNHQYDDILYLSRPLSRRAKMSMTDRGAQFSPFAALTGYDAVIRESARLTNEAPQLDGDDISWTNILAIQLHHLHTGMFCQFNTLGVNRWNRTITGQSHS